MRFRPLPVAVSLTLALVGCGGGREEAPASRSDAPRTTRPFDVAGVMTGTPPAFVPKNERAAALWKDVVRFYEARGHAAAWVDDDGVPTPAATRFATALQEAANEGLDPRDYDVSALRALPRDGGGLLGGSTADPSVVVDADVRTTFAFLRYASDLRLGRTDPRHVDEHWLGQRRDTDLAKLVAAGAGSEDDMEKVLGELPPRHGQYRELREALGRYRALEQQGGWPQLPEKLAVKRGGRSPHLATLRQRLALEGDLAADVAPTGAVRPASMTGGATAPGAPAAPSPFDVYDEAVAAAVKSFEERHGLAPDGVLDSRTIAALNVPVAERLRTIQLNMERWRWMPETLGERYVFVNIPTFELRGYEGGTATIAMRVVTGKKDTPTPIFSDEMEAVVFSPYWNIPSNILREETAPAIRRDPGYLYDNELEVLRGDKVVDAWSVNWADPAPGIRVRQRPGVKNALGQVKFIFPNSFDVYLHDTPSESHFSRVQRAYSHGCVRVESPQALAEWVLKGSPKWTAPKIQAAMNAGREQHVAVRPRIPVYLAYATSWVGGDGKVQFREDIYGHDAKQGRLLPERPAAPTAAPAGRQARVASTAAGAV